MIFMPPEIEQDVFRILTVTPSLIQVEVLNAEKFKQESGNFAIGSYLKITDEAQCSIIALVESYKIRESNTLDGEVMTNSPSFILDAQPIGFLDESGNFRRGGQQIAIPPNNVEIANEDILKKIYASIEIEKQFVF